MKSLIFLSVFFSFQVFACDKPENEWANILISEKHSVKGPFSVEELENSHMIEIREAKKVVPFGYSNVFWLELKSKYKKGDEFYFVHFQDGRFFDERHVLIHNGCIIGSLAGRIS